MPLSAGLYYFYHDGGKSSTPPVVLLAGAGSDHLAWPPEIRRMPGVRVFAPDLPGHGKSGGAVCQSAEDYACKIIEFMDASGLWRAVFVGHSMGGAIALTLALDFPDRTAGLGLISCGARLPVPASILENSANPSTFPFAAQELHGLTVSAPTSPRLAELSLKRLMGVRPTLLHGDLLTCDRFDVSERLGSIHTPVLVVCGIDDRMTPLNYSSSLAALIPEAALQTVDGAGHLVMLEQPQRVAKLLSVFLMTIPYLPGA